MDLREIMEFDHVIRVHEDGSITHPDVYAPEVYMDATWDEHGDAHTSDQDNRDMINHLKTQGWEVLTGWTGQYGYNGPIMHESEFIGGKLADHIRETPGVYVRLAVEITPPDEDSESESIGWIVARK